MEKSKKIKIIFSGYNIETFTILLQDSRIKIAGVLRIDFSAFRTVNLFNYFFVISYFLRKNGKLKIIENLFIFLWKYIFKNFSSGIFKKYGDYLIFLCEKNILILDLENLKEKDYLREADIMVLDTWDMLSKDTVSLPRFGTFNIHPSKLPKYAGALPTLWALKNGDNISSVTYIILNNKMDFGNIVNQYDFNIDRDDDWLDVEKKISKILKNTLVEEIVGYIDDQTKVKKQDETERSLTAKYEEYKEILWSEENSEDIYNKVKLYPFLINEEYCHFNFHNKKILLKSVGRCDCVCKNSNRHGIILHMQCKDLKCVTIKLFRDINLVDSLFLMFKI